MTKTTSFQLGIVAHTCDPNTQRVVLGERGENPEFMASLENTPLKIIQDFIPLEICLGQQDASAGKSTCHTSQTTPGPTTEENQLLNVVL